MHQDLQAWSQVCVMSSFTVLARTVNCRNRAGLSSTGSNGRTMGSFVEYDGRFKKIARKLEKVNMYLPIEIDRNIIQTKALSKTRIGWNDHCSIVTETEQRA